ncbi:hypothetical protein NEOLEDRAFT_1056517 [Neolentinus lepideus HHB14362 ss-1]|uniref:UBA domain-containing protein n=1 Tax=Neolentinus lepideus HHB14362 ss-1 TaxID=1314782 RepID=A0A165VEI0_9AGAM|nr:hypothetical protein NEOLEDRAFT_1056517 [Neolentinus lepideus HHB14362 ss-1]
MADSFADLWNSTASPKPAQPARTLGSAIPALNNTSRAQPGRDVFSMLASAGSPPPSGTPRPITPAANLSQRSTPKMPSGQSTKSASGDAFGGLFSTAMGGRSVNTSGMTIAQRAAQAERERVDQIRKQQEIRKSQSSAWDGLDSLGTSSTQAFTSASTTADDWDFGLSAPAIKSPQTTPAPSALDDDDWGLGDFSKPVNSPAPSKPVTSQAQSLFDFEDFASSSSPAPVNTATVTRSSTPGDFDFGDREDRLLDDHSGDEDDLLGDLGKPVDSVRRRSPSRSRTQETSSQGPQQPPKNGRSTSPPPHILGQIVEMGFPPEQARIALAATETGLDVQAALETLLANDAASDSPAPREQRRDPARRQRERNPESDADRAERTRRTRQESQQIRDSEATFQDQADKLLAQASIIGASMFNKANAFWKEGKEKVQKAYEERAAAAAKGPPPRTDGRPRWMPEAEADDGEDDDGSSEPSPDDAPQQQRKTKVEPQRAEPKVGELFSDAPAVYRSPFRHGTPARNKAPEPSSSKPTTPPATKPQPLQLVTRQAVSASSAALATAVKHKVAGGEKFKLGQYSEAEAAYSLAIAALPEKHLLLVQLYNNRALARLKTGNHNGAVEDCTAVIDIVGEGYHPAKEAKVSGEAEGAGVDLADGLAKAWKRRAEAYEGREKWEDAQKDWERIVGTEWAGRWRNEAISAAGRCRRMVNAGKNADADKPPAAGPPRPKPSAAKARASAAGAAASQAAVSKLREANQAAEAEDQAKYELKDTIDSRIIAWKGGKETNIRALIASLDTVLWPELGWQKVGMHELVTPAQVKIRYMKAIAKVHPDKLSTSNTTVDQRMIANGVFAALNDAWNAFKQ